MGFLYFGQTLIDNYKLVTIFIFSFLKHDKNTILSFFKKYARKNF